MRNEIGLGHWVLGVGQFVISLLIYFEGPGVDRSGCFSCRIPNLESGDSPNGCYFVIGIFRYFETEDRT